MKRKFFYWIFFIGLLVAILLSLFSIIFEKLFVLAHLLVHFQLQYFVVALVCTLGLLAMKKWYLASSGGIFMLLLYILLLHPIQLFAGEVERVDIFYMNSHYSNEDMQPIIEAIEEYSPKTIALVESNPLIVESLADIGLEPSVNHRSYASSCTVYTSNELSSMVEGQTHLPLCIVSYDDYDLITVHAHRPLGKANIKENVEFFDQLVAIIEDYEEAGRKFIIVGDFNATRYSSYFRSRFGKYVVTNLYSWMVNTPFALPIDHVITNMDVDFVRSGNLGSDHRALLVQINE